MTITARAMAGPKPKLLPMEQLAAAAACLKTMAHPMRLRMVDVLMQGEFPVAEVAALCELPEHQTCAHLRLMQGCGLLTSERRGRTVYYRIASPQLPALLDCIRRNCAASHRSATRKRSA